MANPALEQRIVAVIDDHESIRAAIRGLLRSLGFRVEVFASGEDFLRSARIGDTACMIVDLWMPGMSGLDLVQGLRAEGRRLPTIFMSAHDDPIARRRAISAGALAFLSKPFPENFLIAQVRSVLEAESPHRTSRTAQNRTGEER